ncbi:hypothetical protein NF212_13740 [Parasalinivibrio latis]|uniref:hypothetical protein n=1 Tax=Parasalinivibrio latis TaxID=2952610 RepID=UPI0030E2556E
MSTSYTALIEAALRQLHAEGKQASIAAVKSKLSQPVPMPVLLSAIQAYKKNGIVPEQKAHDTPKANADARITELEKEVADLKARLHTLESKLENKG